MTKTDRIRELIAAGEGNSDIKHAIEREFGEQDKHALVSLITYARRTMDAAPHGRPAKPRCTHCLGSGYEP